MQHELPLGPCATAVHRTERCEVRSTIMLGACCNSALHSEASRSLAGIRLKCRCSMLDLKLRCGRPAAPQAECFTCSRWLRR